MLLKETEKLSQPKILIIEDDLMQQKIMSANISSYGYACEAASSGKEGIEKSRLYAPDVIILDLFLPDISGIRVCRYYLTGLLIDSLLSIAMLQLLLLAICGSQLTKCIRLLPHARQPRDLRQCGRADGYQQILVF